MNLTIAGGDAGGVEVSPETFARQFNEALVHQVVVAYLAGARQGSRAQKTRAEVRGGGRKPWRQKGTGRARSGTIRSPIWRGGGNTFASKPQDHSQKVNRKMYRAAMQSILSELVRQERLVVVEEFAVEAPKTRAVIEKMKTLEVDNALIVTETPDENLFLSARNLRQFGVVDAGHLNPVDLIGFEKVVVTVPALKKIEGMLGQAHE